jgi:hypothetical protein
MAKLGDFIAFLLEAAGITKARVSGLLGRDCGCVKRQESLNKWGYEVQLRIAGVLRTGRIVWQAIRHNGITGRIEVFLKLQRMAFRSLFFGR